MNPSGIEPTRYNVLVRPEKVEERTVGGVILPAAAKDKQQFAQTRGVLVAVSPHAFTYAQDWPEGAKPKPGDVVLFSKYAAAETQGKDGETYWLMQDESITAKVND